MNNVIWIVADTFRRDHLGSYGHPYIKTPSLDALAEKSTRFDRHYIAGFPTIPARSDHHSGRWSLSFMDWGPLPDSVTTLAQTLAGQGVHTAAVADMPFYWRDGLNLDRGFQSFFPIQGQGGPRGRFIPDTNPHEWQDVNAWWTTESDRCVARTMTAAGDWLERHYKEQFFLFVDTWDPHEPWDAPPYYTELYMPDYDGEVINPFYGRVSDEPGFTDEKLQKAHATYCGEITLVDTWIGNLLRKVENLGISETTTIVFTSDHGFYFGEHDGMFGKANMAKRDDGTLYRHGDQDAPWGFSPLYEEVVTIPLLIHSPDSPPGSYSGLTSAVDVMPTVLEVFDVPKPEWVEGRSLLPAVKGAELTGRDFTVSSSPFANPGDRVRSVDDISRPLGAWPVTTITSDTHSLLYTPEVGMSQLFDLVQDPRQEHNVIQAQQQTARDLHQQLVKFMHETDVADKLLKPRSQLTI